MSVRRFSVVLLLLAGGCAGSGPSPKDTEEPAAETDTGADTDTASDTGTGPAGEGVCDDRVDGDGDGLTDCLDPDCVGEPTCIEACPEGVAMPATLPASVVVDTLGLADDHGDAACGGLGASDLTVELVAPHTASYRVRTVDSTFDVALRALDGCGGVELACVDAEAGTGPEAVVVHLEEGDSAVVVVDGASSAASGTVEVLVEEAQELSCTDGDDDLDGLGDCDDSDCAADPACLSTCADLRMPSLDPASVSGDTTGAPSDHTSPCVPAPNTTNLFGDRVVEYVAPADGRYTFRAESTDFEPTISWVADPCGGGPAFDCAADPSDQIVADLVVGESAFVVVDGEEEGAFTLHVAAVPATELDCGDGVDGDVDGATDCADADCDAEPACAEDCFDGLDDDDDGLVDCADSVCDAEPACVEVCDDGFDDDGNGWTDCADPDCALAASCQPTCPHAGPLVAPLRVSGSVVGRPDTLWGSCVTLDFPVEHAPEEITEVIIPATGDWLFTLDRAATTFETALYVLDGCGGPELGCVGDQPGYDADALVVTLAAGQTVQVVVDGHEGQQGDYELVVQPLAAAELSCDDDIDDDADGDVDCDDPDCTGDPVCDAEVVCDDGWDDDADGLVDCDDPDCVDCFGVTCVDYVMPSTVPSSLSGDTEGRGDDHYTACASLGALPDTEAEDAVIEYTAPVTGRFVFDTGPYVLYALDACDGGAVLGCGVPDDLVLDLDAGETVFVVVDGEEADTSPSFTLDVDLVPSTETDCSDGLDGDADDLVDCADDDCDAVASCVEDCFDGLDDDGDGLVDCDDSACDLEPSCVESACDDGLDDDGNGLVDCADGDCTDDPVCAPVCPHQQVTTVPAVVSGSTTGLPSTTDGTCDDSYEFPSVPPASDYTIDFTAPADGAYLFALDGYDTRFDAVLYVLESCSSSRELACHEDFVEFHGGEAVRVDLIAGETVTVVVDGKYGAHGDFTLVIDEPIDTEVDCADGLDEDADGLADCYDFDCATAAACATEGDCTDRYDGDGDYDVDCDDADCAADPACVPVCPVAVLPATPGAVQGDNLGAPNTNDPTTCAPPGHSDEPWGFTAPASGDYTFAVESQAERDLPLYVLDGCGGTELACDGGSVGLSEVTVTLTAGQTVIVVVDSEGAGAAYTLEVR